MKKKLSASEALYGFCGWLTSRKIETRMSASNDSAIIAELIAEFCKINNLKKPKDKWEKNLIHPPF
jgi:hypothetical protein